MKIELNVNGALRAVDVHADTPLLWALREELGLTGTKFGCGVAACGACTVLAGDTAIRSCVFPASAAAGRRIVTIEGLAATPQKKLQQAWIDEQVPQCGYCQSGMLMAAAALLKAKPQPTEKDIDESITNLCRCGTYPRVKRAILRASKTMSRLAVLCGAVMGALICGVLPDGAHAQNAAPHPFDRIASVLLHPRCLNCHTVTEFPRQSDTRLRHTQNVVRGKDGRGVAAMRCTSCHQSTNVGLVPGATNWHLAPISMGWERMSNAQVCAAIKNQKKNGGRTAAELIEHMRTDALVLWAWNAGANRQPPPLSHAEFIRALEQWADAGAPCPK